MRRIISIILVLVTLFCLIACSNTPKPNGTYVHINGNTMVFEGNKVTMNGNKCKFSIDKNGKLTITSSGMVDQTFDYIASEDIVVMFGGIGDATWYKVD